VIKRKRLIVAIALASLCLAALLCGQFIWWGHRSPKGENELCSAVSRKHFPLRHWQWSGIPILEGGFVPDPHYSCSESVKFSEPVNKLLSSRDSSYAVVDVNPGFDDRTSEVLLLIQSRGNTFQYSLGFPHGKGVQAIRAIPEPSPAMAFPYNGELAILVNFFGPAKGIYLVPLPLRPGIHLQLISAGGPEFVKIADSFRPVGREQTTRDQFCESRRNDFIVFYEKYSGPCDRQARRASEIDQDFAGFWLEDSSTSR